MLQHHCTADDRVRFDYDGTALLGTVMQDQGMYLATCDDKSYACHSIHKTDVWPHKDQRATRTRAMIETWGSAGEGRTFPVIE